MAAQSSLAPPAAPAPTGDAKPAPRGIQRETAHRLFASEFSASRFEIKGQGEKDPSFLVSPLGAKVNRLHVVGVCTDVEAVGDSGEVWRARVSDPSGVFTVYAGNYQPEAAQAISQLAGRLPAYVAVTGKARTYEPEPGNVFVSIRPESVTVVDKATRDQWLLDTARRTSERLAASQMLRSDPAATAEGLVAKGVAKPVAEGVLLAKEHYGVPDPARHAAAVKAALAPLVSGADVPVQRVAPREPAPAPAAQEPSAWTAPVPAAPKPDAAQEAVTEAMDSKVLEAVQRLEGQKGARWDDVLAASAVGGVTSEDVEEALNRLMGKGLVYEPTLGVLKTT